MCVKAINFREANFLEIPQVIANFHLLLLKIANILSKYIQQRRGKYLIQLPLQKYLYVPLNQMSIKKLWSKYRFIVGSVESNNSALVKY